MRPGDQRLGPVADAQLGSNLSMYDALPRRSEEEWARRVLRLARADQARRARLARDLHDHAGQHLALIYLSLGVLDRATDGVAAAELPRLRAHVDALSDALRQITGALRPPTLNAKGMVAAMVQHVEAWREDAGIPVTFVTDSLREPWPDRVENALFMALVEGLTNVARHAARATRVTVSLVQDGEVLILSIDNDGAAPDQSQPAGRESFGLAGMLERVGQLGGSVRGASVPPDGFSLQVRIPVTESPR